MTMQLYYGSGSPYAWRVLLALVYKGLKFEHKVLEFSKGDTQSPEFLKLNPRGKIPVLVDGDTVIYESVAILAYLEKAYPEKPIFGESAAETGLIYQRLFDLQHNIGMHFQTFVIPIFRGMAEEKQAEMQEAHAKLPAEIALVNGWLAESDFVAGDKVSAADFVAYSVLALVQRILSGPMVTAYDHTGIVPFADAAPNIAAWMQRIEAIPRYDETYPPHWREAA